MAGWDGEISNSEITDWQRCPRKWYLRWYLGRHPADEVPHGPRQQGSRIHLALQAQYEAQLDPLIVLDTLYRAEIAQHPAWESELRREMDQAKTMVDGLLEWQASDPDEADIEVIGAEREVTVPLPGSEGLYLKAKLDQVVRSKSTGHVRFRDWKNSASFDQHDTLAQHPQMRRYALIRMIEAGVFNLSMPAENLIATARDAGQPLPVGGIITTLRRVNRTARSEPPYYRSDAFIFNEAQMVSTFRQTMGLCRQIAIVRMELDGIATQDDLDAYQQEILPPNWMGRDCSWSCPFVHLCPMMDDGSDWTGALDRSGRFQAGDPYAYYADALAGLRSAITAGSVGTAREGEGL